MLARIASALVLIPAVLALLFFAPPLVLLFVIGIIGTLCLWEYFQLVARMGIAGQSWFGYSGLWGLLLGLHSGIVPGQILLAILLLAALLAAIWRPVPMKERVTGMMSSLVGILYIALCLYPVVMLRFDFGSKQGLHWLLILLAVIWVGDVAALVIGKSFGRAPFAPVLSPSKTNEGAIGGILAGMLAAVAMQKLVLHELPLEHVIMASLLLGITGQLGDLAESMMKRAAEVKDSSRLIPGHGGILDRVDSLLFAFPVLYLYLVRLHAC